MNELQDLEALLAELMQAIEIVMQSGEVLSDEFQGQLAQTLELLFNRIETLRAPLPQAQPKLDKGYPSANVYAFGYDPENQRLLVKFQGNDGEGKGPVYGYDKVPQNIFNLFQSGAVPARTNGQNKWGRWFKGKVPSIGASLYSLIAQNQYPYQRVA
jgi:hypothetical protein